MGHHLRNFWQKIGSGQVRSLSYDIIRGSASDRLFKEIVFSAMGPAAIDWNRDIVHGLGQNMTRSNLSHLDLDFPKVTELGWPYIRIVANLALLEVSWGPESECVAIFSHTHVYNTFIKYPMSIRAIDPVCPQAILLMRVTLFLSGVLCVTNIPSINCNDTFLFRIERETRWRMLYVAIRLLRAEAKRVAKIFRK